MQQIDERAPVRLDAEGHLGLVRGVDGRSLLQQEVSEPQAKIGVAGIDRQRAAIRRFGARGITRRLVRGRQIAGQLGIVGIEAAASFEKRERIER